MISTQKVYIMLALCVLFWSGNFIIGRFIGKDIEPLEIAFFRWLFVVILMLPFLFFLDLKKIFNIYKKNFLYLTFISFLGITLFNTLLYIALQTTTATNALLINSVIPILILIFSFFLLKTRISLIQITGIILSTFGVVFLVLKGNLVSISNINFSQGNLWVIASSFTWAFYSTIVKLKPKDLNHIELFVTIVYVGFILILPWYFFQGYTLEREINVLKENWYFFIYVSFFASLLSFYFWHLGIDNIGSAKTGQFTHLMPIFGATLAFFILNEKLEFYHLLGAIFIGIGIYLSLFLKSKIEK